MPISLGIDKLFQLIAGREPTSTVNIVVQRFLKSFIDHGVEVSRIPRLLSSIKLENLQSPEKLLAALSTEILDQTAQLFGIRSQWLEGVDDRVYEYRACYKEPALLLKHLAELKLDYRSPFIYPLRFLSTTKHLDWHDQTEQLLAPVLVEKIADLGDEWICRYHIYQDGFDWSHTPSRIELKAITRSVCSAFHSVAPLFVVSEKEMDDILAGRVIPRSFLLGCQQTNPSLEDYALSSEESVVAKEVDELPEVLSYIEDHKLDSILSRESPQASTPIESAPVEPSEELPPVISLNSHAVKAANAKHAPKNAIKEKFICFYQAQGGNYPNKSASARHFYTTLSAKEQLQFDNKEAAIRTLLTALRDRLR